MPDAASGWDTFPNLRWPGPSSWAKGNGRIQKGVRRAFLVAGTTTITTSQALDWTIVDRRAHWQRRHRWSVVRVLREVADRVGRSDTPGRPWLWRLKQPQREEQTRICDAQREYVE
jgi:hypothetical protein